MSVRAAYLVLLLACQGPPLSNSELEILVVGVAAEGWAAAELPDPGERCWLERFAISFPRTEGDYRRLCPEKSYACYRTMHKRAWLRTVSVPTAVINPGPLEASDDPDAMAARLATHEILHWLYDCTGEGPAADPYDSAHTDMRVWYPSQDSAETIARELLGAP